MRILELPDLHFNPSRKDIFDIVSKNILKHVIAENVQVCSFAGDLWKSVTTNNEKGGNQYLIDFIKELVKHCSVVAIEGTPGHDSPGCYYILEQVGLVLLKPGKVYSYIEDSITGSKFLEPIVLGSEHPDMKAIFFGVPELSKKTIYSKLDVNSGEANGLAINAFTTYMDRFVAPMRLKYSNLEAYMLFHGNVCDTEKENTTDIIMKASDIVINSDVFARANLTRVTLGHIHLPWESKKCSMGYGGSPSLTWGEVNFLPAANLIEGGQIIQRLPYGTPRRVKVNNVKDIEPDPMTAYWLHTDNEEAVLPEGLHHWSKKTIKERKAITQRVTEEEIQKAVTLWDLALLFDPGLDISLKSKFDQIEKTVKPEKDNTKNIKVENITVKGCILFNGQDAYLNNEELENGLTTITGDNGEGKSSILSFNSPFPSIIGKDYRSINEFFNQKGSCIIKNIDVDGSKHKHIININAHTQAKKIECSISIDGNPVLNKGQFKEMVLKCAELYGSEESYLLTSFYIQPLQGSQGSSLMSANMITIRDLVQSIAGVDRSQEKRFALDQVDILKKKSETAQIKIDLLESQKICPLTVETKRLETQTAIKRIIRDIQEKTSQGKKTKIEFDRLTELKAIEDKKQISLDFKNNELDKLGHLIKGLTLQISETQELVKNIPAVRKKLEDNNINKLAAEKQNKIKLSNEELTNSYNFDKRNYNNKVSELESGIIQLNKNVESQYESINLISKPCEHCGKLSNSIEKRVKELELLISADNKSAVYLTEELENLKEPKAPKLEEFKVIPLLDDFAVLNMRQQVDKALSSESNIDLWKSNLKSSQSEFDRLDAEVLKIIIKDINIKSTEDNLNLLRAQTSELNTNGKLLEKDLEGFELELGKAKKQREEIESLKLALNTKNLEEWLEVSKLLGSNKIPALELDTMLASIDYEATNIISSFKDGKFSFTTNTKDGDIDRFNIMIHDNETGVEKSFLSHSPGEKAFLSDCYTKALLRKRADNIYSPIITDEADAPISPKHIEAYYNIQTKFYGNSLKVLIVSHCTEAKAYIENSIEIGDIKNVR